MCIFLGGIIMDYIDYRMKLGLGFNDETKTKIFTNSILNLLNVYINTSESTHYMSVIDYVHFCNDIGCTANTYLVQQTENGYYYVKNGFKFCIKELENRQNDFLEFLFTYIVFLNSIKKSDKTIDRSIIYDFLKTSLEKAKIQYEILKDDDNYFCIPKGAAELDKNLVLEPLEWLYSYPKTRTQFVIALKQYQNKDNPADIADNLRKTIETFFQEFLNNDKGLENNKEPMFSTMKSLGADNILMSLFSQVISTYTKYNNETAKHHAEKVNPHLLEFLIYQTGLLIRTVLVLKNK